MKIQVTYKSIDGCRKSGAFTTLAGARSFAVKWVGATPEISERFGYAVSGDGIGKVTCSGCGIGELFQAAAAECNRFAVGSYVSINGNVFRVVSAYNCGNWGPPHPIEADHERW